MKLKLIISTVVAILILVVLAHSVNISKLLHSVSHFPLTTLILLCIISLTISIVKASRFLLLLRKNNVDITFWDITKVYFAGQATTPLPGGEAYRALLLKKEYGVSVKETSSAVIMQALILFLSSALIALVGSIFLGILLNFAFLALFVIIILGFVLVNKRFIQFIIDKMEDSKHKKVRKHASTLQKIYKALQTSLFHGGSSTIPGFTFLATLGLGFAANIFGGLMIYLIVGVYKVDLSFLICCYIYAMATIIGAVTGFVPGGLGFTEGGMTGVLVLLHTPLQKAVLIVLIYRSIDLLFYILIGILCTFLFYAKTIFKGKKNN